MLKQIGTINGYIETTAYCGNLIFTYDGTTKGLVSAALNAGLYIGDTITSDIHRKVTLVSAPHDNRCKGVWI